MRRAELYEDDEPDAPPASANRHNAGGMARALGIPLAVFAAVTALAALLGAANLGTAATFGQIAFVIAAAVVMLRD
jgi:hypothetical protein